MDIDLSNFKKLEPEIEKDINYSDFLAFDCEFTGI